jgi:hypothetical protein
VPEGGNVTAEQACGEAAAALCGRVSTCAPFVLTLFFGDAAACTDAYKQACLASVGAGNTSATPAAYQHCGADFAQVACGDLFSHNPPASCRPSGGPVAVGMGCGDDWQCASGRCSIPSNATCGVCIDRAPAGSACRAEDDCEYGLTCASMLCVPQGGPGAMCDAGHPCTFGNACKTGDGGTQGTCGPTVGAGQTCNSLEDCAFADGAFCNPQTRLCVAAGSAQPGEQCGFVGGTYVFCAGAGGACTIAAGSMTGTCPAIVEPGGACSSTMPCKIGSRCINGVCTTFNPSTCH